MKTKKIIILTFSLLAVLAVVLGLCLFFCANDVIRNVPNSLSVQKIDKDFVLIAQYGQNKQYCFKLEQKINDQFLTVLQVKSAENHINLSQQNLDLENEFRFSACFANENDGGNGEFCKPIFWSPTRLSEVDYDSVQVDAEQISWNSVSNATRYELHFVKEDGSEAVFSVRDAKFDLPENELDGAVSLFIIADSEDPNFLASSAGEGVQI